MLFYNNGTEYDDWLDMGVSDPLDRDANDMDAMIEIIREKMRDVSMVLTAKNIGKAQKDYALQALAALTHLERLYRESPDSPIDLLGISTPEMVNGEWIDARVRTTDLTTPTTQDSNTNASVSTRPHPDDKVR
jgi:hypothetical protein